jgi:hypothetical protein
MDMVIYIDVEHITDGVYLVWRSLAERYAYPGYADVTTWLHVSPKPQHPHRYLFHGHHNSYEVDDGIDLFRLRRLAQNSEHCNFDQHAESLQTPAHA